MFKWIVRINQSALTLVNTWWRPLGYFVLIIAALVNSAIIPYLTKTPAPLRDLSVLILAFAPLAGLRTYEKMKDPNDPLGQDPQGPSKNQADEQ